MNFERLSKNAVSYSSPSMTKNLESLNRAPCQKGGHRRINIFIRAGDGKTPLTHRRRNRPHRRAANSEKMEMSRHFFHSNSLRGVTNYASETKNACHPEARRRRGTSQMRGG